MTHPYATVNQLSGFTVGCRGGYHEPRPYVGDPPCPKGSVCYCGEVRWITEPCPTCGHEITKRVVE